MAAQNLDASRGGSGNRSFNFSGTLCILTYSNNYSSMAKRKTAVRAPATVAPKRTQAWRRWWPSVLLAAAAFGVYANALANGFVSDDNFQLLNNPLVTDWHKIPVIFKTNIWAFAGAE